jgi:hypothetical protein
MKLTTEEYAYINECLLTYKIRYQEIYDELLDHVTSALECARATNDLRPVEEIFTQIINHQFGGSEGVEKLSNEQAKAYHLKVHKLIARDYRANIGWKVFVIAVLTVLTELFVPPSKLFTASLYIAMMVVVLAMCGFIYVRLKGVNLLPKKYSVIKSNLLRETFLPVFFMNLVFNVPNFIDTVWNAGAKHFMKTHTGIPVFLLWWTVLYMSSCYRAFKHETKDLRLSN